MKENHFFIGWDVGGWNCDKNPRSRDAIVILDIEGKITGNPWRGNLRKYLNHASTTKDFIVGLFSLCKAGDPAVSKATLAIDTPLGFSDQFINLITKYQETGVINQSSSNQYLFRKTERFLFENGLTPLSAVKDMIGSQSTKGIHVLAKYAPQVVNCGVWSDDLQLTVIETYPSPCKNSASIQGLLKTYPELPHDDHRDALICALIAKSFVQDKNALIQTPEDLHHREGWIWIPKDVFGKQSSG